MSTYINELIKAGFSIKCVIESDKSTNFESMKEEMSDRYNLLYKVRRFPTIFIIKAIKNEKKIGKRICQQLFIGSSCQITIQNGRRANKWIVE